jgi:dihydroorotate dehydrogenase
MYAALRQLLFLLPPDTAHSVAIAALGLVEDVTPFRDAARSAFAAEPSPLLALRLLGLDFPSPLGLAAGFDKNALRPRALAALGFGHLELGTVTAQAQGPNPKPHLFRLPADRALINRLGFPNEGAQAVALRLARVQRDVRVPVGISIGKSRAVPVDDLEAVAADYASSLEAVREVADFLVVNVSSPNTAGLRSMQAADVLRELLTRLVPLAQGKPLLLKVAPDLEDEELDALLAVAGECALAGVVATNTTVGRSGLQTDPGQVAAMGAGGLSGPPLRARAVDVVRRARARLGPRAVVVGVGGVENAEHAMDLVRAGADLVQMYTGFIYEGPAAPGRITRDLAAMVEREGARSIAELRGQGA